MVGTWTKRGIVALSGGAFGALLVALVEARSCALAGAARGPSFGALLLADVGVVAPVALVVSAAVAIGFQFLEPTGVRSLREHVWALREAEVLTRSRVAAMAPLAVLVALGWLIGAAHLARVLLARGAPSAVGVELAGGAMAWLVVLGVTALALLSPLRRFLAAGAQTSPRLIDPVVTGGAALVLFVLVVGSGVAFGSTGGEGGVLDLFGVLRRSELDLRPAFDLLAIALTTHVALSALARGKVPMVRVLVALVATALPLGLTVRAAHALDEAPLARALERDAPLGRIALAVLRKATDRDHDGASPHFGGGDCADHDPTRSPTAIDIPGNGIDEDCNGEDTPLPAPVERPVHAADTDAFPEGQNLILITIDTLRTDVGFMGYPLPTTPNLDRLAEKGVIFDRAYSMASYTGKSLGPILIGKYPSETLRNGAHFNTYAPANVFVAERFQKAGIRTLGAASHWYFHGWSGLTQGIDVFDLSAKPASGQGDTDTSVTSKELTDAALKLLAKPENTGGRFFLWVHYFDPHAQYAPHPGAPDFLQGKKGFLAEQKALYDGEVWFTDQNVGRLLDYVQAEPWGKKTAVVVTADHGEAFADHNMSWHGVEIWESLVRVPLLVYYPGARPHHVPVKRSQVDLVPTLLDLMRIPAPEPGELSGVSLAEDLLAPEGAKFAERDVYIDMPIGPYTGMRRALIHGETPGKKLIQTGGNQYSLFDLAKDPGEKEDLAGDKAQLVPMQKAMQSLRAGLKEIEVKPDNPSGGGQ